MASSPNYYHQEHLLLRRHHNNRGDNENNRRAAGDAAARRRTVTTTTTTTTATTTTATATTTNSPSLPLTPPSSQQPASTVRGGHAAEWAHGEKEKRDGGAGSSSGSNNNNSSSSNSGGGGSPTVRLEPATQAPTPRDTAAAAAAASCNAREALVANGSRSAWEPVTPAAARASATATASTSTTMDVYEDVRKYGYMRKQKHGHKRFFVLKGQSHLGPARLEYYDSEKKWRNRSTAPKRVIPLYQCFTVSRRADAKNKYLVALYTKDEYFAMVADNDQEQESWYLAISELMNEGKKIVLEPDEVEENYGNFTPGTAFREVWQINVKPKGLGQTKNLTGVYRLCLSSKMIHFVKINSDVPSVHLQLMNIRRCGHSENFFFIEVGRSASIGPGELWMQVDDSVVAQNMHETILETMRALKAFTEFRPRSKSQSSGTNPISFLTRRHLGNLPPSQTGLQRRSRTESVTGVSVSKNEAYRFRTSSEGEGTMTRPFGSVTGSLIHLNSARMGLSRGDGGGRYVKPPFGPSNHSRSVSLPVTYLPSTTSPVSVSSSSGHGSVSDPLTRPSSSSICGSPSDGGFISSDEYGSSPGDFRYFRVRSNTPDSLGNTPPIQEENCLCDYISMDRHINAVNPESRARDDYMVAEKGYRKRTHSLTTPGAVIMHQKTTQTTSSLEESNVDSNCGGIGSQLPSSASPKLTCHPCHEDYCDLEIGSSVTQSQSRPKDDGYMPMMPGAASTNHNRNHDYMPMNLRSISAPKQISSLPASQTDSRGYMVMSPNDISSTVRSVFTEYNSKLLSSNNEKISNNEYMDMSQRNLNAQKLSSDAFYNQNSPESQKSYSSYYSLPRSFKTPAQENGEDDDYVPMCSPGRLMYEEASLFTGSITNSGLVHETSHSPRTLNKDDRVLQKSRVERPTRLSLGMPEVSSLPRLFEQSLPPEPKSPGEYINIAFSEKTSNTPYSLSAEGSPSSLGSSSEHRRSPMSDYMSVDLDVQSPKPVILSSIPLTGMPIGSGLSVTRSQPNDAYISVPLSAACVNTPAEVDDYTEMTFNLAVTATHPATPKPDTAEVTSPTAIVKRLCIIEQYTGMNTFPVLNPLPDANHGPKVIRADPQGRRRHSSETFSSTPTVASSSTFFADGSKRHSSASFDNVWLKQNDCVSDEHRSTMCRNTSAGFQNGLNYIALDLREDHGCSESNRGGQTPDRPHVTNRIESQGYASIDFSKSDGMKYTSTSED
ncbi:insulin receptor substrate 2-A-like [Leucoraja erinacea]|uniref:insulin receptor substrate 2-A-like n=1 Tax=Leucoraja erinaceus TaxID=7782 RepID=UPI0024583B0B|nr:insulin receptor substrate 2-A-like [Leucoraja erinacea]